MNIELWFFLFVVWSLLHTIGDFGTSRRRFKGEFWIVANPLHWLFDLSPLRRHGQYSTTEWVLLCDPVLIQLTRTSAIKKQTLEPLFWKWLAWDQSWHVLLNFIWTGFLTIILEGVI